MVAVFYYILEQKNIRILFLKLQLVFLVMYFYSSIIQFFNLSFQSSREFEEMFKIAVVSWVPGIIQKFKIAARKIMEWGTFWRGEWETVTCVVRPIGNKCDQCSQLQFWLRAQHSRFWRGRANFSSIWFA